MKLMSWTTIVLVIVAALGGIALAQGLLKPQDPGTVVSPGDAHAQATAGKLVLIDVRTPQEWRETGVPASAHAVTMHQDPKVFLDTLAKLTGGDKSKAIAIICRTGNRTTSLQGQLKQVGFTNVLNVVEGVVGGRNGPGWQKAGLPMRPGGDATKPPVVAAQ
jgi:rhodanese-related sulfurtransferase